MDVESFLKEQARLEEVYGEARKAHPEIKSMKKVRRGVRPTHQPGSIPDTCEHCKKISDAVLAINKFDIEHLGSTRFQTASTRNTIEFMRRVIKMMKEGGEI